MGALTGCSCEISSSLPSWGVARGAVITSLNLLPPLLPGRLPKLPTKLFDRGVAGGVDTALALEDEDFTLELLPGLLPEPWLLPGLGM